MREVVRIHDASEFAHRILSAAAEPVVPREQCSICRDIPRSVKENDPWPDNAGRLHDIVRVFESGAMALRRCDECQRLYWYTYWFKMGEDTETTLDEVNRAEAEGHVIASATEPWALHRDDGMWILAYQPSTDEVVALLSKEELEEVEPHIAQLPYSLRTIEGALRALQADIALTAPSLERLKDDDAVWLKLQDDGWLRCGRLGFEIASVEGRRIQGLACWTEATIRNAVKKAAATPESIAPIDADVLARLRSIDDAAFDARRRIESGERWWRDKEEIIVVAGSSYWVREQMQEATPLGQERFREWLLEAALNGASLATEPIDAERRATLDALLDPHLQVELIKAGRLTLYGSAGSAFAFRNGQFAWDISSGGLRTVTEGEARAVVQRQQYSWLKWR